jgi:ribosomal protein S18 acetylase RimI-like enzyme
MDQVPEEAFDRILELIDRSRRTWDGSTTSQIGPFTLDPEYARPTLGATSFTESEVRELLRCANEEPQWASIATNAFLVEWNELEWIVERVPALAPAVSNAGLAVSTNPLLIKRPTEAGPGPVPIHAEIEICDPESDPRELIAAWKFLDPHPSAPTRTPRDALEQVRLATASVMEDEVATWVRNRTDSGVRETVVRFRGTIVGAGMHEPFAEGSEITNLAVLPRFRRRGFGTAVAAALAADAFDNGVDLVFVESSPVAVTMYERAGFQQVGSVGRAAL